MVHAVILVFPHRSGFRYLIAALRQFHNGFHQAGRRWLFLRSWSGFIRFGSFGCLNSSHQSIQLLGHGRMVKCFLINDFTVDNAVLCQPFSDINGINILKLVLFLVGKEPILVNQAGNAALYSRPGNITSSAFRCDGKRRQIFSIFLPQPRRRATLPAMLPHIADNSALAFHAAVPFLERLVNSRLG